MSPRGADCARLPLANAFRYPEGNIDVPDRRWSVRNESTRGKGCLWRMLWTACAARDMRCGNRVDKPAYGVDGTR
jgi:hypothetical protein